MSEKASEMGSAGADSDFVTLRPGQVVGRYRIVTVLGQGGFGITYRAMDSELGREVAIKEYLPAALAIRQDGTTVLPRSTSAAADFAWGRDRFIAEGRTLAALHRVPGIVLVHDFIVANGTAYLVMELLAGQTLQEQVERRGPLDVAKINKIVWALLNGLEKVHSAGFLHRDIKPANILLDGEVRPTLIDFGASRAAVAGRSQAMTAVFTPGYAPVEQFTAAAQGSSTDIYGLAATLYFAITGKAPPNAVDRILDDAYVPLACGNRPFPRELLAGIDAGLAVRAADRPQSIAAWRTALSPSIGAANAAPATVVMRGTPSDTTSIAAPPRPASQKRPVLLLAAGVAAVCALAGGWYTLGPRPSAPPSSTANGSGQCEGTNRSEWCRGAFRGFPPGCWHAPMTVRNGAISGSWTSPGASEPNTFAGRINAGGEVQLTYNGIGQETYTNQHFTVQMTGRVVDGVMTAGGRAGPNSRDFTVRLQCR